VAKVIVFIATDGSVGAVWPIKYG